jgi:hypothetical protein
MNQDMIAEMGFTLSVPQLKILDELAILHFNINPPITAIAPFFKKIPARLIPCPFVDY